MAYVIFFCSALIGHPQINACEPAEPATYATLGECKAAAAKMPLKADAPPRAAYVCLPQSRD